MRLTPRRDKPPAPPETASSTRLATLVSELERVTAELRALTKATTVERREHQHEG